MPSSSTSWAWKSVQTLEKIAGSASIGLAIKDAVAAFGDKDQMNVHCRSAMPAVSKVLDFVHGPDNNENMERRQAFRFQLMPNGEQQRQMRCFAGCARYVYNKALALKKERYEKKEQLTRFQLDKLLVQ